MRKAKEGKPLVQCDVCWKTHEAAKPHVCEETAFVQDGKTILMNKNKSGVVFKKATGPSQEQLQKQMAVAESELKGLRQRAILCGEESCPCPDVRRSFEFF